MKQKPKAKRVRRPKPMSLDYLEASYSCIGLYLYAYNNGCICLKDAKKLHRWLTQVIKYLEAKK